MTNTYQGPVVTITQRFVNGEVRVRTEKKNVLGKTSSVVENGVENFYYYNPDGSLGLIGDPINGTVPITSIHYDTRGRKDSATDPDLGTWSYSYSGYGELMAETDAQGRTTTMSYVQLGRLKTKVAPGPQIAQWVYDSAPGAGKGKIAAMVSGRDTRLAGSCADAIPLVTVNSGNRAGQWFTYTANGDLDEA